jgi:catechol 2,3-dioxygenase-like lactoylglutathione lyase family enzyme
MSAPTPLRADHVVIPVADAAASLAFYRDTLGLPLVDAISGDDWGGRDWLMMVFALADDRQVILVALRGAAPPTLEDAGLPPDARHYAFAVASDHDLAAWRDRLRARDVAHWEEDHGDQRSIYFADPSGTILELTTPPTPSATDTAPAAADRIARWLRG